MLHTWQLASLSDLINFVDGLDRSSTFLFRGQQRESWALLPKIARIKNGCCTLKEELAILTEFKKGAHNFLQTRPENDWSWLSIAQHHGLATRVLDWSLNPLVGLWFAVNNPPSGSENGVLWIYSPEERSILHPIGLADPQHPIENQNRTENPFGLDRVKVFFPNHEVPRIRAQSGVFTVHPRVKPRDEFLPFEEAASEELIRVVIPPGSFEKLKLSLDKCGVHAAALMPDLDGLAQRIVFNHECI
ncbi:MAG: FRG domain-containing protein [Syntrophothermus sp.]